MPLISKNKRGSNYRRERRKRNDRSDRSYKKKSRNINFTNTVRKKHIKSNNIKYLSLSVGALVTLGTLGAFIAYKRSSAANSTESTTDATDTVKSSTNTVEPIIYTGLNTITGDGEDYEEVLPNPYADTIINSGTDNKPAKSENTNPNRREYSYNILPPLAPFTKIVVELDPNQIIMSNRHVWLPIKPYSNYGCLDAILQMAYYNDIIMKKLSQTEPEHYSDKHRSIVKILNGNSEDTDGLIRASIFNIDQTVGLNLDNEDNEDNKFYQMFEIFLHEAKLTNLFLPTGKYVMEICELCGGNNEDDHNNGCKSNVELRSKITNPDLTDYVAQKYETLPSLWAIINHDKKRVMPGELALNINDKNVSYKLISHIKYTQQDENDTNKQWIFCSSKNGKEIIVPDVTRIKLESKPKPKSKSNKYAHVSIKELKNLDDFVPVTKIKPLIVTYIIGIYELSSV